MTSSYKNVDHLYRCLLNLLKFVRDRTFERARKQAMGKPTMRQENIYERHRLSLKLQVEHVQETESSSIFKVMSSNDNNTMYEVSIIAEKCPETSCFLKCIDCGVCIHTFMCSCPDSLVLNNMCKHIHLVQRKVVGETRVENEAIHGMSVDQEYVDQELSTIAANVSTARKTDPEVLHTKVAETCRRIETAAMSSYNPDALTQLQSQLNSALHTFISMNNEAFQRIRPVLQQPANKNLEKQQRFFSIKKKRKKEQNVKYAKPTRQQKQDYYKEPEWLPVYVTRGEPVHAKKTTPESPNMKSVTKSGISIAYIQYKCCADHKWFPAKPSMFREISTLCLIQVFLS